MKKSLFAVASAITILASGSVSAQTSMNGPYYANPSWDQSLPAAQRFIVLSNMNNEAVLDRETGLVWQRTPNSEEDMWEAAVELRCRYFTTTGGRLGWRMPSLAELQSLVDTTQSNPSLPPGHPFLGVSMTNEYWTVTTIFGTETLAATQGFAASDFGGYSTSRVLRPTWCVRGGVDTQAPQNNATATPP